jgi:hypothetical protein
MWIIDAAPKLVRWVINTPDGKPATQIDQEMERR